MTDLPVPNEAVLARAPGMVWRLGPDRVLLRRVDVPDGAPRDLHGAAARVWISLDEPGTRFDIVERAGGAGLETETDEALRLLLDDQLIIVQPTG